MKKLILGVGLLFALIGASVGILKWQKIGPFRFEVAATEKKEIDVGVPGDKPSFIDMDPIIIPLFQDDQVAGNIQLAVKLEIRSNDAYAEVRRFMPKLADVYLRDLYVYIPRYLIRAEQVDIAVIKARLKKLSDKVVGPGVVADILVQAIKDNQPRPASPKK